MCGVGDIGGAGAFSHRLPAPYHRDMFHRGCKGYDMDVRGYGMDVRGYGMDVRGYGVDVMGYGVDVRG
eukprot:170190-Prorocentrum_minimum.AAC.1